MGTGGRIAAGLFSAYFLGGGAIIVGINGDLMPNDPLWLPPWWLWIWMAITFFGGWYFTAPNKPSND